MPEQRFYACFGAGHPFLVYAEDIEQARERARSVYQQRMGFYMKRGERTYGERIFGPPNGKLKVWSTNEPEPA